MTRFISFVALLALVGAPLYVLAQEEAATEAVAEVPAEESTETDTEVDTEESAEESAAEPEEESSAPEEASEEPAAEEAEVADETEESEIDGGEAVEEELDEEAVEEDGPAIDWAGLMERLPAFLGIMHRAAVHMPIGLWVLGAVFVLVGVVVPSWRNQIPLACLIGGALCAFPAAISGWCLGVDYDGDWAFKDIFDSERMSESIVQHRWMAVALVISSTVLSVIALVNQRKKSAGLGFVWRVGLLALAAAVAWEGHIGGMVSLGDDWFFETAVNDLLGYEFFTIE